MTQETLTPICRAFLQPVLFLGIPVAWFWSEIIITVMIVAFSPVSLMPLLMIAVFHIVVMGLVRWEVHALCVVSAMARLQPLQLIIKEKGKVWYAASD